VSRKKKKSPPAKKAKTPQKKKLKRNSNVSINQANATKREFVGESRITPLKKKKPRGKKKKRRKNRPNDQKDKERQTGWALPNFSS